MAKIRKKLYISIYVKALFVLNVSCFNEATKLQENEHFKHTQGSTLNFYKILTIPSAIESRELLEIGSFKTLMVAIHCPHNAWPGSAKHKVALSLAFYLLTLFIQ